MDEAEDAEYGPAQRGDELPEELRRREGRLEKIREAKVRFEEGDLLTTEQTSGCLLD